MTGSTAISSGDGHVSLVSFVLLPFLLATPLIYLIYDYVRILLLRQGLPPGPVPLPIFGSYFATPRAKPWVKWERLSKEYGIQ